MGERSKTAGYLVAIIAVFLSVFAGLNCICAPESPLELGFSLHQVAESSLVPDNRLSIPPISKLVLNFDTPAWLLSTEVNAPLISQWIIFSIYQPVSRPENQPSLFKWDNQIEKPTTAKLGPLLRMLVKSNRHWLKSKIDKLDITQFSDFLAVYGKNNSDALPVCKSSEPNSCLSKPLPESTTDLETPLIGVLIKTKNSGAKLLDSGIGVVNVVGDIVTARVRVDELLLLAQRKDIAYIEASHRLEPELDKSVPMVGGNLLQKENPSVSGSGTVIGVVDTGIDYQHLDFREDLNGDGVEEASRIQYIWDQTGNFGSPPLDFPYGTEYGKDQIKSDIASGSGPDTGMVRESDTDGHGTHVAGIACGDGSSSNLGLSGMAPEADIIAVKTTFYTADVVDAVSYILQKGSELNKPVVINLSLGGHLGPHDGTSLFEQAIDQLLEGPAKAIITSAGNAGNDRIHISGELNSNSVSFSFIPRQSSVHLDFWYPGESNFMVEVTSPGVGGPMQTLQVRSGNMAQQDTPDGLVLIDNASGGPNPNNKDKEILIRLEEVTQGESWLITIKDTSGGGRFDGWVALADMGKFPTGDTKMTISEPGNAYKVITVGAFTTKHEWQGTDGSKHHFIQASEVGQIAPFSSYGPTRDGREKPDISAPGSAIASSLASESDLSEDLQVVLPDGQHAVMQGTSQAAPHVSGACALLLEAEPHIEPKDLKKRLTYSAKKDEYTGHIPNLRWGYGKLNASKSFDTLGLDIPSFTDRPTVKVGPNPAETQAFFYYDLPYGTTSARLVIFNVVGITVFSEELDLNENRYQWDLRNNNGQKLANGLYVFMIISDKSKSRIHRLVIRHK